MMATLSHLEIALGMTGPWPQVFAKIKSGTEEKDRDGLR